MTDRLMDDWWIEGVIHCPGPCDLYFDVDGPPQELQDFIAAHDCTATATAKDQA